MESAIEEAKQATYKLSESMYAAQVPQSDHASASDTSKPADDVVEADYEVIEEE